MANNIRQDIQAAVDQHREPEPQETMDNDNDADDPVGLAQNAEGVPFQCGTCQYFDNGICHNENPKLNGQEVHPDWCCNLYDHEGMKHVID